MTAGPTPGTVDVAAAAALMTPLTELVVQAAHAIMAINRRAMAVTDKSDGSPVTEADLAADRVIADGLARLAPDTKRKRPIQPYTADIAMALVNGRPTGVFANANDDQISRGPEQ